MRVLSFSFVLMRRTPPPLTSIHPTGLDLPTFRAKSGEQQRRLREALLNAEGIMRFIDLDPHVSRAIRGGPPADPAAGSISAVRGEQKEEAATAAAGGRR